MTPVLSGIPNSPHFDPLSLLVKEISPEAKATPWADVRASMFDYRRERTRQTSIGLHNSNCYMKFLSLSLSSTE
jgi:hypothetical protein